MKKNTKLITAGRSTKWTQGLVNPPVSRGSTVVFDSVKQMKQATAQRQNKALFYGRRGTQTSFAFQEAMVDLEGGAGCYFYPCGTAAITASLLAFLKTGDHLLMVDTAYEPTRNFCDGLLASYGIETTYYDPTIGTGIEALVLPNTKVIFLESPGSLTMEVQDVPGICAIAQRLDIVTMLDNTWATPVLFDAFKYGVDISIQAATKYIVGHSDVMLGTASANARCWDTLREHSYLLGQCTSPDDLYMGMRGLRTLGVRLAQHEKNALKVANWLAARDDVDHVRHPALSSCPGHQYFERDFNGASGLFSFVMKKGNQQAVTALLDGMEHFSMGYSWGGYESLIMAVNGLNSLRSATNWAYEGSLIRVHIGLEDVDDLINDLDEGLARFAACI